MRNALIVLIAMAGALAAQPGRPPMAAQYWWQSRAINSLNLSEAQTKQLNTIQSAYVGRLMDLRQAVNRAEKNLDDIFNEPTLDDLKAAAAVDQYANARDNLTRALSELSLKMRGVLTAEQWQELVARQAERQGRGLSGRGRRGGPPPEGSAPPNGSPQK